MADRRAFLLRIDPALHDALQRWASDELRSLNSQIEFLLRREASKAGRLRKGTGHDMPDENPERPDAA